MTPARLSECLTSIRWTPEILADALGCDVSLVNAWLDGDQEMPMKASAWMGMLATVHKAAEAEKPGSLKGKRFTRDKPPGNA